MAGIIKGTIGTFKKAGANEFTGDIVTLNVQARAGISAESRRVLKSITLF